MSCRLIREADPGIAQPLFAERKALKPEEYRPWRPDGEDVRAATATAEVATLRQRVHELELTLPQQVAEARAAAYRDGEAAGHEKATAAARPVLDRLSAAIREVAGLRSRIREEAEVELVALSLAIARRILHREISIDPDAIQGLVRAALEKVQAREITEVRLYPAHEEAVRKCLAASHGTGVKLISDPALAPGDLIIETKRGNLEASIETQLKEIERGFADRIRR